MMPSLAGRQGAQEPIPAANGGTERYGGAADPAGTEGPTSVPSLAQSARGLCLLSPGQGSILQGIVGSVVAGSEQHSSGAAERPAPGSRVVAVTKHWGSGLRRIRWVTEADGAQAAAGEDWDAVVRPVDAGGYEAVVTVSDRVEAYPGPDGPERTTEQCKGWVRLESGTKCER